MAAWLARYDQPNTNDRHRRSLVALTSAPFVSVRCCGTLRQRSDLSTIKYQNPNAPFGVHHLPVTRDAPVRVKEDLTRFFFLCVAVRFFFNG